jgi:hypothetical protein
MRIYLDIPTRIIELWLAWQRRLGKISEDTDLRTTLRADILMFVSNRRGEMRRELDSAGIHEFKDLDTAIRKKLGLR